MMVMSSAVSVRYRWQISIVNNNTYSTSNMYRSQQQGTGYNTHQSANLQASSQYPSSPKKSFSKSWSTSSLGGSSSGGQPPGILPLPANAKTCMSAATKRQCVVRVSSKRKNMYAVFFRQYSGNPKQILLDEILSWRMIFAQSPFFVSSFARCIHRCARGTQRLLKSRLTARICTPPQREKYTPPQINSHPPKEFWKNFRIFFQ